MARPKRPGVTKVTLDLPDKLWADVKLLAIHDGIRRHRAVPAREIVADALSGYIKQRTHEKEDDDHDTSGTD